MVELLTGNWRSDHLFNLKQHWACTTAPPARSRCTRKRSSGACEEITPAERKDVAAPPWPTREAKDDEAAGTGKRAKNCIA
jgi:hypothetical protein